MTDRVRIGIAHIIARAAPDGEAEAVTDYLYGETLTTLDRQGAWLRLRNDIDGYEGWAPEHAAVAAGDAPVTHRVAARLTDGRDAPDGPVSLAGVGAGSPIRGTETAGNFIRDAGGHWFALQDLTEVPDPRDRIEIARTYLGVPYVWGGRHGSGIDCSGLVQVGAMLRGLDCERDTKDQRHGFGEDLGPWDAGRAKRGDVLYMPGHVALIVAPDLAIHADGRAGRVHEQPPETIIEERGFAVPDTILRRPAR